MKMINTSILKRISLPFVKMTIVNPQNVKNENNNINDNMIVDNANQNNTPKEIRRGINMTDEQKDFAQKIKDDIISLYNEGYSIRMIANHYNDLYSIRDKRGNVLKEAISRETVRKILNNEEVSLKTIIGNPNFMEN
ncbi:MAG: hypothetical protein ACI4VQ_03560 [Clostridia bacterium]